MFTVGAAERQDRISFPADANPDPGAEYPSQNRAGCSETNSPFSFLSSFFDALFDFLQRFILFSNPSRKLQGNVFGLAQKSPRHSCILSCFLVI